MHCRLLTFVREGFTFGREGGGNQERQVVEAALACCGNCLWNSVQCTTVWKRQPKVKLDHFLSCHLHFQCRVHAPCDPPFSQPGLWNMENSYGRDLTRNTKIWLVQNEPWVKSASVLGNWNASSFNRVRVQIGNLPTGMLLNEHSGKKWFCLQDSVFWGWIFLILRRNFPNFGRKRTWIQDPRIPLFSNFVNEQCSSSLPRKTKTRMKLTVWSRSTLWISGSVTSWHSNVFLQGLDVRRPQWHVYMKVKNWMWEYPQ